MLKGSARMKNGVENLAVTVTRSARVPNNLVAGLKNRPCATGRLSADPCIAIFPGILLRLIFIKLGILHFENVQLLFQFLFESRAMG